MPAPNKKSRVFVGPVNISGLGVSLANALKAVGVTAHSYAYHKHPFGYSADFNGVLWGYFERSTLTKLFVNRITRGIINSCIRFGLLIYCLFRYDTFLFISPHTLFYNRSDLPILKFFGKQIAFILPGCGERDPQEPINAEPGKVCNICDDTELQKGCLCQEPVKKRRRMKYIEKYGDHFFGARDLTGYFDDPEDYHVAYNPSPEPKTQEPLKKFEADRIVIAHFPSSRVHKGSKYVLPAMEKVQAKYGDRIEFITGNMPHAELMEVLETRVHLLLDQFFMYPGVLSVEAMAMGCAVMAHTPEYFRAKRPGLPVIYANIRTIEEAVTELIEHPEKLKQIAEDSVNYYHQYHSPKATGAYYKRILNLS